MKKSKFLAGVVFGLAILGGGIVGQVQAAPTGDGMTFVCTLTTNDGYHHVKILAENHDEAIKKAKAYFGSSPGSVSCRLQP